MSVDWRAVRGHILVVAAVAIGIVGMEMVFSGAMDGSLREASRGVPLLLIGLWWAGRELGRSMRASRGRRMAAASIAEGRSRSGPERPAVTQSGRYDAHSPRRNP